MKQQTNYFDYLPTTNYNGQTVTNLLTRYDLVDDMMSFDDNYYIYKKKSPNERFDVIAQQYYGDSNLAWLVMLSSNIFHWKYETVLDPETFERYIKDKYNLSIKQSQETKLYYLDSIDRDIVDVRQYNTTELDETKKNVLFHGVSVYDHETALNEQGLLIKLVSKSLVGTLINAMKDLKGLSYVE